MYRRMIEHPEWLPKNGKDEMTPYYRLGENAGRIYRIFPKGKRPGPIPKLDTKSNAELAELLGSSNGWLRDKAQMMLLWRDARDTIPALEKMAQSDARPLGRLHAACTLDGLNDLKPEVIIALLADKDPHVRTNAIRLAEKHANEQVIAAAVRLTDDDDAKVRMQLACSLGEWTDPQASAALARLLARDSGNVFIAGAIFSSALPHIAALANAPEIAQGDWRQPPVAPLLQSALGAGDGTALTALLRSVRPNGIAEMRRYSVWLEVLASKGMTADAVAAKLNHEPLRHAIHDMEPLPALALQMLQKEGLSSDDKMTLGLIVALTANPNAEPPPLFQRWLQGDAGLEDQERAIRLLARLKRPDTPALLLRDWNKRTPALRSVVLDSLMGSEAWTLALLAQVKEGAVRTSAFDAQRLARMRQHQDRLSVGRAEVIEKFKPALTLQGNAAHGKEVFGQLCIACHRKNDVGKEVGPDLRSVVEHEPEKLLVSILDPSASIEPGYVAFNCKLRTGEHLYGIIATETAESITFKFADGNTRAVLRSEIADLRSTQTSLMPDGLEATLTPQSLADLIRYLKTVEEKK
jgi:putative heme-binding domain-containing protein